MTRPNLEVWLEEVKGASESARIGMCLIHNGVVRGTTRDGKPVSGMELTYDRNRLQEVIDEARGKPGVIAVKAWVNEGRLNVGDDIMYVLVAADIREHAFGTLQELVQRIKTEVVSENEMFAGN